MRLKKENGFSFLEFIVVVAAISVVISIVTATLMFDGAVKDVQKYFGLSAIDWSFSEDEKALLKPMVERKLDELSRLHGEAVAEKVRISVREDITPDNADVVIQALRMAKDDEEVARNEMMRACGAARYFELVSPDYKWCQ